KLSKVLDIYEKRLEEAHFLADDEFSLADLSLLPNTYGTDKGNLFTSRENVGRWWDEILSQGSWKKVVYLQKGA
ncbi:glutathione s-transferase f8, partial [Quercus suber]